MMRALGVAVVLLGIAAIGFIVIDATRTHDADLTGHASEAGSVFALQRLVVWAVFLGVVVAATSVRGVREAVMPRHRGNPVAPTPPPNGKTADMIDAETNEVERSRGDPVRNTCRGGNPAPPCSR